MSRRALTLAATLMVALALAPAALAADCPKTTLGDVEDEVMCVVCGTPLGLATEAPQANRERALIQREIDRCQSKDQIKTTLASEFGDEVLALPGNDGFDLAAYLVPMIAVLLASGGITVAALRWRRRRGDDAAAPADAPSAADERLQTDLDRYDL